MALKGSIKSDKYLSSLLCLIFKSALVENILLWVLEYCPKVNSPV